MPPSPTPPLGLRERRRRKTADDIQHATLHLILTHGFAQVTTDMIAAEAGISPRTFFNYYPNKEAATVGLSPSFSEAGRVQFRRAEGSLVEDLGLLTHDLLSSKPGQKELVRKICAVIDVNPALLPAFQHSIQKTISSVAEMLIARDPDLSDDRAALMAEVFSVVLGHTVRAWADDPASSLDAAARRMTDSLRGLGAMMAG